MILSNDGVKKIKELNYTTYKDDIVGSLIDTIESQSNQIQQLQAKVEKLTRTLKDVIKYVPKPENVEWLYEEQCESYYYTVKKVEQLICAIKGGKK
jgi:archaellum component FlaC